MSQDHQTAFTLVELLVVLAVLGVLLSLAPPALDRWVQDNRDEVLRNLLLAHLHQARAQAITGNRPHLLCGSSDGTTCNGDWAGNWLIFAAEDGPPILRQQVIPAGEICWRGFSKSIRFQPNGTSPVSNGRFALCRERKPVWELALNRQGRVRQSTPQPGDNCCATSHPDI